MSMKLGCYVIKDALALSYGVPFFLENDAIARRMFRNLCADPNSDVGRNPLDFQLCRLGFFTTADATFNGLEHVVLEHGSKPAV